MSFLGYVLLLTAALLCSAAPAPDEQRQECPLPYGPNNMEIINPKEVYYSNDTVTMRCVIGYKMNGSPTVRCIEGKWEQPPVCTRSTPCRKPPAIRNGVITESFQEETYVTDDIVKYQCNPGYNISGSDEITCENGQWSALPTCTEQRQECPLPYSSRNMEIIDPKEAYYSNDAVTMKCVIGYKMTGSPTVRCFQGKWEPPPQCIRTCPRPPRLDGAAMVVYGDYDSYPDGADAIYHCLPGYRNNIGTTMMTCKYGKWIFLLPKGECIKKSCGYPGDIPFGSFQLIEEESFFFGAVVEYFCNDGYQMVSNETTRQCTASGWSNYPPHCEEISCKTPVIDNGEMINPKIDYKDKEVIQFTCKESFTPNTSREVTCTKDGWNPKPSCNDHCQKPEPINGAQLKGEWNDGTYPPGKVANFACLPEYTQDGPIKMACIEGIWWHVTKGECKVLATSCKRPPPVTNARINGQARASYASGEKVTYSCNPGYSMARSLTGEAVCENIHWIDLPVCRKIEAQCGPPPVVQFGDSIWFVQTSYKSGDFVEYKCPEYYILKGHKIVRCLNGFWDDAPVCLEPCTAKEKDMEENNVQLMWGNNQRLYTEHGDSIAFICKSEYEAPPDTQMRIFCEQGKLKYPKCFKRGSCVLQQLTMITNNINYNISTIVDHGQTITFECNEGMMPENTLEAKCEWRNINYPKCSAI